MLKRSRYRFNRNVQATLKDVQSVLEETFSNDAYNWAKNGNANV